MIRRRDVIDMTGQRFTRLTVLAIDPVRHKNGHTFWICRCDCGTMRSIDGYRMRHGEIKSCGCWRRQHVPASPITHHDSFSPEYKSWQGMFQRCTNPNIPTYPYYGGRGIKVCQRWLTYENFLADMGRRPSPKHSLDRRENAKGYSPSNCRWATPKEQANNSRRNRLITYRSDTLTLSEWSGITGIKAKTICSRLDRYGWPVAQALGFEPRTKALDARRAGSGV